MKLLRIVAIALPQLLALLLAGAYFDLLGGWNHSDSAFGSLWYFSFWHHCQRWFCWLPKAQDTPAA